MLWVEQDAKRIGERWLDEDEKEALQANPASKIVFIKHPVYKLAAQIFVQLPEEYGFSGIVGKRYEAMKDYLRWYNFDLKEWVPIFVQASRVWAQNIAKG